MLCRPAVLLALVALIAIAQATVCTRCGLSSTDKFPCNCHEEVIRPAPRHPPQAYVKRVIHTYQPHLYAQGELAYDRDVYGQQVYAGSGPQVYSGQGAADLVAKPENLCCDKDQYVHAVKPVIKTLPKPVVVVTKPWYPCAHHRQYQDGGDIVYNGGQGLNYQGDRVVDLNYDDIHGHVVREDADTWLGDAVDNVVTKAQQLKKPLLPGDFGQFPHKPVEYVRDGDSLRLDEDFLDNDEARRYSEGEVNAKTHLSGGRLRQPVDAISLALVRNAALKAQRAAEVTEEGLAYGFRRLPQEVKQEEKKATDEEGKLYAVEKEIIELQNLESPRVYSEDRFTDENNEGDFEDQYAEIRLRNRGPSYDELGFKKVSGTCGRTIQTFVHERPDLKVPAPHCGNPVLHPKSCGCGAY